MNNTQVNFNSLRISNQEIEKVWRLTDLHLHTNRSDGLISPKRLVSQIKKTQNPHLFSITDHNTLSAYRLVGKQLLEVKTLYKGVEIDCSCGIDILVYQRPEDVNGEHFMKSVSKILRTESKKRLKAAKEYLEDFKKALSGTSIPSWFNWNSWDDKEKLEFFRTFTLDNLLKFDFCNLSFSLPSRDYISKPHIIRYLFSANFFNFSLFAKQFDLSSFDKKTIKRKVKKLFFTLFPWPYDSRPINEDLIKELRRTDNILILAHPGKSTKTYLGKAQITPQELSTFIARMVKDYDLDGVECLYRGYRNPEFDYNQISYSTLKEISIGGQKDYFATAGSDSHRGLRNNYDKRANNLSLI